MQVQTELRPMFSYSFLIIIIAALVTLLIYLLIKFLKKKEIRKTVIVPSHKDIINIKKKYLLKLQELLNNLNNEKITSRKAYQNLSNLIRNFIHETTNINVQNYTLKEISLVNIPILYELVSEYYNPEFAKFSKGNIILSIEKTRGVIEKWN